MRRSAMKMERQSAASPAALIPDDHGPEAEANNLARPLIHNSRTGHDTTQGEGPIQPPIVLAEPPDGGWGWVVTFSSFMMSVLVDGVCFSFGLLFNPFREAFNSSKSHTSWAGSVLNGSYLTLGPIVGSMVNIFGCRKVAIFGSFFAGVSLFISSFSQSMDTLIFTYGFLTGSGFGFMYLPAIVMVGYYFEKRRALATGIACCGSGIGTFIFAPLVEYLLERYDWRGTLWILSAVLLNGAVFGSLYRPLVVKTPPPNPPKPPNSPNAYPSSSGEAEQLQVLLEVPNGQGKQGEADFLARNKWKSMELYRNSHEDSHVSRLAYSQDIGSTSRQEVVQEPFMEVVNPMVRVDVLYGGSIQSLMHRTSVASLVRPSMQTLVRDELSPMQRFTKALQATFDFSLLLSPTFLLYGFSCFLCMLGFFVPFTYIPPLAETLNIEAQRKALLLSVLGVTNTLGRVAVGYISDQPWADSIIINSLALVLGGLATCFVTFYTTYAMLAAYMAFFGLSIAVFVSLRSVLMVELMGLEKLTSAFGLVTMFQGLSSFIGAPIAGSLSDSFGNFTSSFLLSGISLTLAGLICLPLRRIASWEKRRKASRNSGGDQSETRMA